MRRRLASGLLLVCAALLALVRLLDPAFLHRSEPPPSPRVVVAPRHATPPPTAPAPRGLALDAVPGDELRAQVQRVVESVDRSGHPPEGVAQGGRRGGQKGLFDNAQGKLPRQPRGYYTETDIWPREPGHDRGTYRLIFGREGEVYYTADHYRTFTRLR